MSQKDMRFIGMDIHKDYEMVAGVNRDQEIILTPHRVGTK